MQGISHLWKRLSNRLFQLVNKSLLQLVLRDTPIIRVDELVRSHTSIRSHDLIKRTCASECRHLCTFLRNENITLSIYWIHIFSWPLLNQADSLDGNLKRIFYECKHITTFGQCLVIVICCWSHQLRKNGKMWTIIKILLLLRKLRLSIM